MLNIKKISIIFLILIITFSLAATAAPETKIENMNFKNAELIDVLRTIAEVANVNLITDGQVAGQITVNLKNITFKKALDLITQSKGIDYKWDQNTVVVAPTDRLESIYANLKTEFVKVNSNDFDNIGTIIKEIFPETQITLDPTRRQFILKGEKENLVEVKEMIDSLDSEQNKNNFDGQSSKTAAIKELAAYSESYQVLNAELEDLKSKLRTVNTGLDYKVNSLTETMTISGNKKEVKEAISMAKTYDQSLEPETRNIRVDYVDTEQISEIVGKFYPEIKLHVNAKRKEIIINGAKNKLDGVEELINEINKPQYQVVIETRVEEISSDFSRELGIDHTDGGIFNIIKESTNNADGESYKIEKLDYSWPDVFKALDTSTDTKTLASPKLMTLNGEEANLSILEEKPYKVVNTDSNGEKTTSWEYAEAGVELTFTPWISKNNEIELEIAPTVSSFSEIADSQTGEGESPPPAKKSRSVETTLRLKDNETFAVGGLIQTDKEGKITKIPLLGDLPLFGELFKFREPSDSTNELIIFVTPHIIKYGDEITNKNIINPENEKLAPEIQKEIKLKNNKENQAKLEQEKTKEEIIKEYLEKRSENRKEILNSLKTNKDKKEYQDLTPAELEEILAD
ncbi:type II secretion system protein GspD [Halanaerobium praevalens]|uniref:Type II and III secretion system protein n=1 Tax=Halanaerobium praevalens (strain ATCC 33744 / DSM 2228 / GSL) TaxID=572479 RepID=E3DRA1_HALPG|nr:type II secretion system protein GspD [Halanaerobium praevalens]ADO77007.1 type II and III secretion system protein [Halanaerobium praevalens DSM 2228]